MVNKEDFKKAQEPEHVKITEVGQEIIGKLVGLEVSTKFGDGYALKYVDNDKLKISFINKLAYDLFVNNAVKTGDEFLLVYKEDKKSGNNDLTYRVFELYFK